MDASKTAQTGSKSITDARNKKKGLSTEQQR